MKLTNILEEQGKKYRDAIEKVKKVYVQDDRPWIIGYSGGKDSTATCTVVLTALSELPEDVLKKHVYIISSDTLVETPLIINEIDSTLYKMDQYGKNNGLPISTHKVQPKFDNTFWANLIGRGYPCPNQTFRWCTDRMKIEPANRFIKEIVASNGEAIMVLGVRKGESISRDRVLNSHTVKSSDLMRHTTLTNAFTFAPIIDFTVDDVWDVLLNYPCPWGGNNQELFNSSTMRLTISARIINETIKSSDNLYYIPNTSFQDEVTTTKVISNGYIESADSFNMFSSDELKNFIRAVNAFNSDEFTFNIENLDDLKEIEPSILDSNIAYSIISKQLDKFSDAITNMGINKINKTVYDLGINSYQSLSRDVYQKEDIKTLMNNN